jgi:hypothetical protein
MLIVWHLCNYLKINFGNLLGDEVFKFNNDLVNHHQLVMILINEHNSNMVTYRINFWTN